MSRFGSAVCAARPRTTGATGRDCLRRGLLRARWTPARALALAQGVARGGRCSLSGAWPASFRMGQEWRHINPSPGFRETQGEGEGEGE